LTFSFDIDYLSHHILEDILSPPSKRATASFTFGFVEYSKVVNTNLLGIVDPAGAPGAGVKVGTADFLQIFHPILPSG
jgi:hypothetical protein